ncbi:MAG: Uma2 family endonuclease [Candidatus Rokubacteria bacterium]|nr:Uma2 family endonuclease [Candidatus Rokubacteria bacterium]
MTGRLVESDLPTRRWKRAEYERLVELGMFQPDDRLELVDGLLVLRERQTPPYATTVAVAREAIRKAFGPGWLTRAHGPVALDDDSEPEPDITVVAGAPRDYLDAHPARPVLIVEVALTTLALDREYKSSLYARAGIPDYWIVNLVDHVLEVRRGAVTSEGAPYAWAYESLTMLGPADSITPLAAPFASIPIANLLP